MTAATPPRGARRALRAAVAQAVFLAAVMTCAVAALKADAARGGLGALRPEPPLRGSTNDITHANALSLLTNRTLVFVGDSITRYQYLNLVHFLATGAWRSPAPHNENEKMWTSWTQFYEGTTARHNTASTHEICDCYRAENEKDAFKIVENRYFKHWGINASVSYIQMFGTHTVQGHSLAWLNGTCEKGPCVQAGCAAGHCAEAAHPFDWAQPAPGGILQAALDAFHPSILVVNAGYWSNYTDPATVAALVRAGDAAARASVDVLAWKTTTPDRDGKQAIAAEQARGLLPALAASGRWSVFDAGGVALSAKRAAARRGVGPAALYWDDKHFRQPVYARMNARLLAFVRGRTGEGGGGG